MTTAGFVLAGGRSRRMGRDKALLPWGSGALIEEAVRKAREVCGRVAVVGSPDRYAHLGLDGLADVRPGLGPLGGLETALLSRRAEYNLILACDMPDLCVTHLRDLMRYAQQSDAKCVVSRDETGRIHPLCAVYRPMCLPVVQKALNEGRLKLLDLVAALGAHALIAQSGLRNVNSPEEWEALQAADGL